MGEVHLLLSIYTVASYKCYTEKTADLDITWIQSAPRER